MRKLLAIVAGLAMVNLVVFLWLGFHERIPIWIFSFGFTDLVIGTGFYTTALWILLIVDDDREARIVLYSYFLLFGLVIWLPSL